MTLAELGDYVLVFVTGGLTVLLVTPLVRRLSALLGAVDHPDPRRIHTRPTPRLGGLALFAGLIAAIGVASRLATFEDVFRETSEPEAILLASIVIVALGVADDTRGVSAPAKLAGQILAAGVLALFGVTLSLVYIPPGNVVSLPPDLTVIVTVVAIVAMINAVNLVDGLDGLAAGIVAIASLALFAYVQLSDATRLGVTSSASLLLIALAGVAIAFLVYNFHPASVFMGDTGAMLLGLVLGAAGVSAIGGVVQPTRGVFAALSVPVLVPAMVLAVPFADTAWAILRRLRSGAPVFSPDKRHLHHRLVEIGHSQRRAVLIMYYWSALVAFAAVGLGLLSFAVVAAVVLGGVVLAVVVMSLARLTRRPPEGREEGENFVFFFTKSRRQKQKTASDQAKRSS